MRLTRTLPIAAMLAAISCTQDATLEIEVDAHPYSVRWPPGQDSMRVQVVNGLDDPKGLAGLEVSIAGDLPGRVFAATDFIGQEHLFVVPDVGTGVMTVRLVQDGQVVAEGTEEWSLESEVEWTLVVTRGPRPSDGGYAHVDLENPECEWFWCHSNWRFSIVEEAANYEYEALWVTLKRVHPDECEDVCWGFW